MAEEEMEIAGAFMQLRVELLGHEEDVRGLAVNGNGFLSASRDRTVKVWKEAGPQTFNDELSLVGHQDYVTAVAVVPSDSALQAAFVSGSRDKTVRIWDSTGQSLNELDGHKWQVTAVAIMGNGCVASASLDGTIRVWSGDGKAAVLEGHEGPVQCLAVLPDGALLSGSNDKSIRRWVGGTCQQTITGHGDTVRGLAIVPGLGFVSASHDQTLQIWTSEGESVATLIGHSAIIYSAAATADGLIASASEDNTARLWRTDGSCLQVIEHQACVWDVVFLSNGDLVTGCSDFAVRVWTAAADRAAPAEAQKAYTDAMEARKAAAAGDGKTSGDLPEGLKLHDAMALTRAGERDGQTIIIREGGGGTAYSWSSQRGEWEKLGEVMSGPQDTMAVGSKQHLGRTWDYVFDVDIADGAPVKKLPANKGEDPYDAADRFLQQEQLPLSYREQIAQFVVENSHGGITYAMPAFNSDPFTGSGAYVPAGSTAPAGHPESHPVTGGGSDPFTGGLSAPSVSSAALTCHIPARTFVAFTAVPSPEALGNKIREHNQQLDAGSPQVLSAEEAAPGGALDQLLARAASATKGGTEHVAPPQQLVQLSVKLLGWPPAQLFPALDVARLLALNPGFASALAQASSHPGIGMGGALTAAMAEPQTAFNQQTALRLSCNSFVQPQLRNWIVTQVSTLLDGFAPALGAASKAVRLAAVTLLLNCAILNDAELKMQALSGLLEFMSSPAEADAESLYRAIVAVGTLVYEDSMMRTTALDIGLSDRISKKRGAATGKVSEAAQEVLQLLS